VIKLFNRNEDVKITCKKCHKKIPVERTTRACPVCNKNLSTKKLREIKERFNGGFTDKKGNYPRRS
jgi:Zn finger protein HypA/HybF involved in hydrogenase expression